MREVLDVNFKNRNANGEKMSVFEVQSYIGSEIAEPGALGERPPRSAKFVVSVSWGWGPASSRCATYFLSTDRERSAWYLWEQGADFDTGKSVYARVACGVPYRGVPPRCAAESLLREAWKSEWQMYQSPGQGVYVDAPGILNKEDIEGLEQAVFVEV